MDAMRQEQIRMKVQDATSWQFEAYTFEDVIEDSGLSSQDVEWAKENLDWKVYIQGNDDNLNNPSDLVRSILRGEES